MEINDFLTIETFTETKFKEKGSLFIGQSYPVQNEEAAVEVLEKVKKSFYDATHHCYAYSLLNNIVKYSDAGEPSGTAGIRILNAIQHFNLQNLIVIVIRYFGGTKLGVGPLGKAYYNSSYITLEKTKIIKKIVYKKINIEFDYGLTSQIHHVLTLLNARIVNTFFETKPVIECLVKQNDLRKAVSELTEMTKGNCKITEFEETYFI